MKKRWIVLGFVLLVFLVVILGSESEENKRTTLTTTLTITPHNTFEQKVRSILDPVGGDLKYYGYDLEINDLVTGKKGIMVTVHYAYHNWLLH